MPGRRGRPRKLQGKKYTDGDKKKCFILYLENNSVSEIAERTGINENTISTWVTREQWSEKRNQIGVYNMGNAEKALVDRVFSEENTLISGIALMEMLKQMKNKIMDALRDKDIVPKNWDDIRKTVKDFHSMSRGGDLTTLEKTVEQTINIPNKQQDEDHKMIDAKTGEELEAENSNKANSSTITRTLKLREYMRGVGGARRFDISEHLRDACGRSERTNGRSISSGMDREEVSPGEWGELFVSGSSVSEGDFFAGSLPGHGDREIDTNGSDDLRDQ